MTDLDSLIEELEKAEEGSRELDAKIHCLLTGRITHPKLPRGFTINDLGDERRNRNLAEAKYISSVRGPAPHYTTSLDAALTLVPENADWNLDVSGTWNKARIWAFCEDGSKEHKSRDDGKAATPALAFMIAVLRARQEERKWT